VSPSPSPSGPTEDDLAALALIEEMAELVPGAAVEGDTPTQRLHAAIEALRARLVEVGHRLARWMAEEQVSAARLATAEARTKDARMAVEAAERAMREKAGDLYMTPAWNEAIVFVAGSLEDAGRAQGYMAALLGERVDVILAMRASKLRWERERDAAGGASAALAQAGSRIRQEHAVLDVLDRKMHALLDQVVISFGKGSAAFSRIIAAGQSGQRAAPALKRFVFAPVEGRVSSPYGPRIHPIYGYRSMHTGTDLAAPAGAPVMAPRDGVVLAAGDAGPFGLSIVIDHGERIATVLSHLSSAIVESGDRVGAGEAVGLVGCTGWCTGPHLHFEVWFELAAQDPAGWIIAAPASDDASTPAPPPTAPAPPAAAGGETLAGLRNPFADLSARP